MTERKLPQGALEYDFIITDETLNRNGWRIIVAGIDLEGFRKNPVCCVQHDTYMIPVGKWKNLRVEDNVLKGTVEFDRNDPEAVRLYWKYKDGYMNAVSLHIIPLEESKEEGMLLEGQRYATVTKSEMLEISLVTIPGQRNAVRLSTVDGKEYKLNLLLNNKMNEDKVTVESLQQELKAQKKLNAQNLIRLHQQRGVVAEGEVEPLTELALSNYDSVSRMLDARKEQKKDETPQASPAEQLAENLVKLHFDRGAITEEEKTVYRAAAVADYEATRKVLEAKKGANDVGGFVGSLQASAKESGAASEDRAKWTYLDWYKKDLKGLLSMQKTDPERYKRLEADFAAVSCASGIYAQGDE